MKKLKLLAILGIVFFASSTVNAQVSFGINIGVPVVTYHRTYAPQRVVVREYRYDENEYRDSEYYDRRRDDRSYYDRKHDNRRYKGWGHKGRGHQGRCDH